MRITYFNPASKFVVVELTRRNLEILLAKLNDPHSRRSIRQTGPDGDVVVVAVENEEHYKDRDPGPMLVEGEIV